MIISRISTIFLKSFQITSTLLCIFLFNVFMGSVSIFLDYHVAPRVLLCVVMVGVLILSSYIGERYVHNTVPLYRTGDSSNIVFYALLVSVIAYFILLLVNIKNIPFEAIDYSYTKFRELYLLVNNDTRSFFYRLFLDLSVLFGGIYVGKESLKKIGLKVCCAIILGLIIPIFLLGSRSIALVFLCATLSGFGNIRVALVSMIKNKILIGVFFSIVVLVSLLRGIEGYKIIFPFDSFLVGPHLLTSQLDTILNQANINSNKFLFPGYSNFSGIYTGIRTLMVNVDVNPFGYIFEDVFWKRHEFNYLPVFDDYYNSYYTAGIAYYIEGPFALLVELCGISLVVYFIKNTYIRLVVVSLVYAYAFLIFQYSIFHSTSYAFIFLVCIMSDIIFSRIFPKALTLINKINL